MKTSDLIKKHMDAIVNAAVELYEEHPNIQTDIYLYPDGRVTRFDNISGNSWLDDDHIFVMSIDHSGFSDDDFADESHSDVVEHIERQIEYVVEDYIRREE